MASISVMKAVVREFGVGVWKARAMVAVKEWTWSSPVRTSVGGSCLVAGRGVGVAISVCEEGEEREGVW